MRSTRDGLFPDAAPAWLKPLVDNLDQVPDAYRRRVPSDVLAGIVAANDQAARAGALRDAAVLVLFSGPAEGAPPL
ncbi:coenzyme A pyrophosphatase, partial [Mycolicibacterium porcinum]